ncbi:hypothetical protein ACYCEU_08040 [Actinotignum timonense]|uniref:hypothetical protein n=1 Tax=Actinotignum TaxID=1653174 RepID=UPI00254C29F8|nr:hypothetical protein [Actinotignum timonense]MDK6591081.1 hypothetical protein [Actinotignum timonense]MDK6629248.1 hypothetical protein [Actinotignum timonense]
MALETYVIPVLPTRVTGSSTSLSEEFPFALVANPNALRPDMQAPTVFEKSTPLGHNFFKIETACP